MVTQRAAKAVGSLRPVDPSTVPGSLRSTSVRNLLVRELQGRVLHRERGVLLDVLDRVLAQPDLSTDGAVARRLRTVSHAARVNPDEIAVAAAHALAPGHTPAELARMARAGLDHGDRLSVYLDMPLLLFGMLGSARGDEARLCLAYPPRRSIELRLAAPEMLSRQTARWRARPLFCLGLLHALPPSPVLTCAAVME